MKRAGLASIRIVSAIPWGCVLSVIPDTSKTIFLDTGETQVFEIRTSGFKFDREFLIHDITDGETTPTIERNNFRSAIDRNAAAGSISVDTATYTPDAKSAGTYEIRVLTTHFTEDTTPLAPALLDVDNAVHSRSWEEVVVRGVAILPNQDLAAAPGTTLTCTAQAYPEGEYAYQWLLDGAVVAIGAAYDFSPVPGKSGPHTLTVKASGEGRTYSLTRKISVASD